MSLLHLPVAIFLFHFLSSSCSEDVGREKRSLIWREGASRLQVITGFGVPVDLKRETVIIGSVFKANYGLPTNSSHYTNPYVLFQRKKRAATRWDIYDLLSQAIETRGFEGKSCILRAICEVASTPLEKNYGLFHELMHVVFTPTSTKETAKRHADNEYFAAQMIGEKKGKCDKIFRDCSTSLMDMLTVYNTEINF